MGQTSAPKNISLKKLNKSSLVENNIIDIDVIAVKNRIKTIMLLTVINILVNKSTLAKNRRIKPKIESESDIEISSTSET